MGFFKELFGKTRDERIAELSPVGKRIYYLCVAAAFAFIFSVWIFGAWWR